MCVGVRVCLWLCLTVVVVVVGGRGKCCFFIDGYVMKFFFFLFVNVCWYFSKITGKENTVIAFMENSFLFQ